MADTHRDRAALPLVPSRRSALDLGCGTGTKATASTVARQLACSDLDSQLLVLPPENSARPPTLAFRRFGLRLSRDAESDVFGGNDVAFVGAKHALRRRRRELCERHSVH